MGKCPQPPTWRLWGTPAIPSAAGRVSWSPPAQQTSAVGELVPLNAATPKQCYHTLLFCEKLCTVSGHRCSGGHMPCLASSSQPPQEKLNCSPKHITLCPDAQGRSPAKARHRRQGAAATEYLVVASALVSSLSSSINTQININKGIWWRLLGSYPAFNDSFSFPWLLQPKPSLSLPS